jgi:hypothetical protein
MKWGYDGSSRKAARGEYAGERKGRPNYVALNAEVHILDMQNRQGQEALDCLINEKAQSFDRIAARERVK